MNCPKCGRKITEAICGSCNYDISSQSFISAFALSIPAQMNIKEILDAKHFSKSNYQKNDVYDVNVANDILNRFGKDILLDGNRFCAIFDDMVQKLNVQQIVFRNMQRLDLFPKIYRILQDDTAPVKSMRIDMLLTDEGFSSEWRRIALDAFGCPADKLVHQVLETGDRQKEGIDQKAEDDPVSGRGSRPLFQPQPRKKLTLQPAPKIRPAPTQGMIIENGVLVKYDGSDGDVIIPKGVTAIGGRAFGGCLPLIRVTIPESVTEIGTSAFSGCENLSSVTIPKSVTKIGINAFKDCPLRLVIHTFAQTYAHEYAREHNIRVQLF